MVPQTPLIPITITARWPSHSRMTLQRSDLPQLHNYPILPYVLDVIHVQKQWLPAICCCLREARQEQVMNLRSYRAMKSEVVVERGISCERATHGESFKFL